MKTCDLTHTAPQREPRQPLRQTIGQAIQRACRAALRLGLGLRIPAARIHQYDLQAARDHAAAQVRLALEDCSFWMGELASLDEKRAAADAREQALRDRRDRLSMTTPTSPTETL